MSESSSLRWNDSKKRKREENWKKKRDRDDDEDSDSVEPSGGSIPLEEIKQSEEFKRKVTFADAPRRKYAVAIAYLGTAYKGLQINPGILTVEAMLEKALYLAGGIDDCNFGDFHKLSWSRAGRTDKGVHAVTNCCSMNLRLPLGEEAAFVESVNSFLPSDIRVLTMTKTMKSFSAKVYCDGRLYRYMLPSYLLADVNGINTAFDSVSTISVADASSKGWISRLSPEELSRVRASIIGSRLSADDLDKFRSILKKFEGTHKFHNFTSEKSSSDASAKRFIISMDCSEPMVFGDNIVEWVCVSLRGQSFLLNQIRKMIGLAIDIFQGARSVDIFDCIFAPDEKIEVYMVPGLGLYLKEIFFERYHVKIDVENERKMMANQKLLEKGKPLPAETEPNKTDKLEWAFKVPDAIESFEKTVVWPHICEQEESSKGFLVYLDSLRNFRAQLVVAP